MRGEFNRLYWCMLNSDTIQDGEYYVIHTDHIHDFKRAIDHYFEENKKIEKLDKYARVCGDIACEWSYSEKKLKAKIDELIDEVNKLKEEK